MPSITMEVMTDDPEVLRWAGAILDPDGLLARAAAHDAHGYDAHEIWLRRVILSQHRQLGLPVPNLAAAPLGGIAAEACVLRSLWIARCPFPGCHGEEGIWSPGDWFYCCSCGNAAAGGRRIGIRFGETPESVRQRLATRPLAHTRNWLPRETLATLEAENLAHGHERLVAS